MIQFNSNNNNWQLRPNRLSLIQFSGRLNSLQLLEVRAVLLRNRCVLQNLWLQAQLFTRNQIELLFSLWIFHKWKQTKRKVNACTLRTFSCVISKALVSICKFQSIGYSTSKSISIGRVVVDFFLYFLDRASDWTTR